MKTLFFLISFILAAICGFSQDCAPVERLGQGTTWEITSYNKKDKVTGYTNYEVIDVVDEANATIWKIKMIMKDDKKEVISDQTTEIKCEDGIFKIDMKQFMNPATMEGYKDMEVEIDATDAEYPSNPQIGQELPDARILMDVTSSGMTVMSIETKITDRKVEKKEEITTPAGTFHTLVIKQNTNVKNKIMNMTMNETLWFLPGFGVVKTESYNKKGKYTGKTLLTAFSKG